MRVLPNYNSQSVKNQPEFRAKLSIKSLNGPLSLTKEDLIDLKHKANFIGTSKDSIHAMIDESSGTKIAAISYIGGHFDAWTLDSIVSKYSKKLITDVLDKELIRFTTRKH